MELISIEQRRSLIRGARSVLKVELRDHYPVDDGQFKTWQEHGPGPIELEDADYIAQIRTEVASGKTTRRVKVVSEPISEYHRFVFEVSKPFVEAGEDIRWAPRRLLSTVLVPGNDFFVIDEETVLFNVFSGEGQRSEIQRYDDPAVVRLCIDAFEAVWAVALQHHEFRPA